MGTEPVNETIAKLAETLDDARILTMRLRRELTQRLGDEMLNPPRHLSIVHSDIEAAIIRLHYVGQLIELNGA